MRWYIKENILKYTPKNSNNMKSEGLYLPLFGARAWKAFNEEVKEFIKLPKTRWDA